MNTPIIEVKSISQLHKLLGYESPQHPLISIIDVSKLKVPSEAYHVRYVSELYCIMLKDADCGFQYGRNTYDFEEGVLVFFAPNQVVSSSIEVQSANGWMLFFHPDLLRKSALGKNIGNFSFFSYEVYEALHLSKQEESTLNDCIQKIELEYRQNIDGHTQTLLISNLELLLNYCNRFYERQFHTRSNHHKDIVAQVESYLKEYYSKGLQVDAGSPSVQYLAGRVNLSPNYLSDVLKRETGRNTKDHINDFVVDKAKNELLGTSHSVSEIAYDLGFNYPHYFSRLFKQKTGMSPKEYREGNWYRRLPLSNRKMCYFF